MKDDIEPTPQLLEDFPTGTGAQWREAAEQLLKGAPFDKVMRRRTPEGITLEPIFHRDALERLPAARTYPGFDGYTRGTRAGGYRAAPWTVAQEIPLGMPREFNRALREDLNRGQNALNVIFDIATARGADPDNAAVGEVGACGLSMASLEDMRTAFEGIHPEAVEFHLRGGCSALPVAAIFFAWLEEKGFDRRKVTGSLGMDPLATKAAAGAVPASDEDLFREQAVLAEFCVREAPGLRSVGVATGPYHQAGASSVEELGIALATGAAYLRELTGRGIAIDDAAGQIRFSLTVGRNFFMEIAKIRALRPLWARVVEAFGGGPEARKLRLHARTGLYNKTRKDPYVNMLRTTTEALAAVIGGVDSLCVGAFDETTRVPNAFSRRIARNTQIILQEECGLGDVADPAGGAWAVESLTDEICRHAWGFFQEIEGAGGMAAALEKGFIQERLQSTAGEKANRLNQRRDKLVGTNTYPDAHEQPLDPDIPDYAEMRSLRARDIANLRTEGDETVDADILRRLAEILEARPDQQVRSLIQAARSEATLGEICRAVRASAEPGTAVRQLRARRLASDYEALRDAADAYRESRGHGPRIFLCNLGPLRRHKIRADFTRGFFETGGFEVIDSPGFDDPRAAVAALAESGAAITVVCGTDADYEASFADYARAIKSAYPAVTVLLAGQPGDHEEAYREAGMDDYIFVKSNNYETNRHYLAELGAL